MELSKIKRMGFVGAGKMAEGILKGLLESGLVQPDRVVAADIDQNRLKTLAQTYTIQTASNLKVAEMCDPIFLAVKPQHAEAVFNELKKVPLHGKILLSIMAGISTRRIEEGLSANVHVIRIMPNIAATVQAAASAFCLGRWATDQDATLARSLLETFGSAEQVGEELMDAITGLSGSGPAYVFALMEAMADGGVMMGLPRETALKLTFQTVFGAAKLALVSGEHPAILREKVTSPGGTTSHGLAALEESGFRNALIQAVKRATLRSQTLGENGS